MLNKSARQLFVITKRVKLKELKSDKVILLREREKERNRMLNERARQRSVIALLEIER